jgi:hypothetical protein
VLVGIELLFLVIIIILAFKIINEQNGEVKGIQYISIINKKDITFDKSSLKYFYEPKAESILIENPEWLGYSVTNTMNKDSLNERFNYDLVKDGKTYRIITLGDSWTYGWYVNTNENYSEVLEDELNKDLYCGNISNFEVINLGVGGYDIEYALNRFIKRGVKYKPDLVIWFVNNWNFEKIKELFNPIYTELGNKGIPDFDPKTRTNPRYQISLKRIKEQYGNDIFFNYNKEVVQKFIDHYSNYKFLIMSLPFLRSQYKTMIKDLITNTGFKYSDDVTNVFNDDNYHFIDNHPNVLGHKIIAKDIFNYLVKNEFKKCSVK